MRRAVEGSDRLVPIRRPFTNNRLYVLDERLQPRRASLASCSGRGRWRGAFPAPRPDRRAVSSASLREERLYRTGDLARCGRRQ